jgi:hypothetical protein
LQGSKKFKGDAKDLQACGFWKQTLLGMGKLGTKKLRVKEYFVKQWCPAVSDNIDLKKGRTSSSTSKKVSAYFFFLFLNITILLHLCMASLLHNIFFHT